MFNFIVKKQLQIKLKNFEILKDNWNLSEI